jgi:hypothetical protein
MVNLIITILMMSNTAFADIDCNKHKIYCNITKNKPNINKSYAMEISNIIYRRAKHYKIDPILVSAIFMQESSYNHKAINCTAGVVIEREVCEPRITLGMYISQEMCDKINNAPLEAKVCTDFGIGQIYYKTVYTYGFDLYRITNDLEYSIEYSLRVLNAFKKRYADKEKYWWTRYNASSPSKRELYRKRVERYK